MSLTTTNKYGKISISDEAVAAVASQVASECYGVVEMVSRRFSDNFEVFVILKVGVNIETVRKAVADTVKFALELFTGMRVKKVHVNVVGIRV